MKSELQAELEELSRLAATNCNNRGAQIVATAEEASKLLLLWLQYLRATALTGTADCLLEGALSAVHEGIACIALGLVRPALNSLRLQIDLCLAWLYFKDHSVEWQRVQDTGDGFRMKTDLLKYLAEFPGFTARFTFLRDVKTRSLEDPYRLLSAHIHGQNASVLPQVTKPKDIVSSAKMQDEALRLQRECSEYINDIFWGAFASRWAAIPVYLTTELETRFKKPEQRAKFFT